MKIVTGQRDDYITGCLLTYPCFKISWETIEIDLSKQSCFMLTQMQYSILTLQKILDQSDYATMFLIIEEAKENILDFSQRSLKLLWMPSNDLAATSSTIYFTLILININDSI